MSATPELSPSEHRERGASIYATYKQRDAIGWYEEFIATYPNSPFVADARDRITELEAESKSQREIAPARIAEIIVTTGSIATPHEPLGEVSVDAIGFIWDHESAVRDGNKLIKEQARQLYGNRADAVINVTYRVGASRFSASGLAVHFTPSAAQAPTTVVRSSEERLKEIKRLLDQGLITQEEYEKKRGEIVNGL